MRVAGRQPFGVVLRAGGRERREPSADAVAGRMEPEFAALVAIDWADKKHAWLFESHRDWLAGETQPEFSCPDVNAFGSVIYVSGLAIPSHAVTLVRTGVCAVHHQRS
jgi:hypothetical protein